MTARAEFDVGPLSWVKGEIDHAIQRAQEALRAFAANSADTAQLRTSQSHLHQAHGALSIVGLDGVTRLSEELESLLAGIEKEASLRKAEIFGLAERAFDGILAYLDQLMAGNPNQPLRLYRLYRDLVSARGGQADPTDLYFPDLSFRPPKRDKIQIALKPGEADKNLRERSRRHARRGRSDRSPAGPDFAARFLVGVARLLRRARAQGAAPGSGRQAAVQPHRTADQAHGRRHAERRRAADARSPLLRGARKTGERARARSAGSLPSEPDDPRAR